MTPEQTTPQADGRPLFIVGCVRSGTTMTRDLLRRVPNFICPEETHIFRWAEPFQTPASQRTFANNKILDSHREIDGVTHADYRRIAETSRSKKEFQLRYITAVARAKGITGPYRWFEKTPQNIFGAALMAQEFPKARFLHLVRNPLNVVASLIAGRQMSVPDLDGACNYWLESVMQAKSLRRAYPNRVLNMRYEDLISDAPKHLDHILDFAGVSYPSDLYRQKDVRPERDLWRKDLTPDQAKHVAERCDRLGKSWGYDLASMVTGADR